ncbi:MAG: hypothetical protein GWP10_11280, partial [Nitrospiraceae bacterium]|nr:hypothetical protein [Nitrospiraceae bacterium]
MDKKILEKFKKLGPYKGTIVSSPWETNVIDVEEIHRNPYEQVIRAIDYVNKNKSALALVLQGEPGSGKSHLLWRISRNAEEKRFLFVSIVPYVSVSGISYATMLQSMINSLLKKHSNLKSRPVDHLVGWAIKQGLQFTKHPETIKENDFVRDMILKDKALPYVAKNTFEMLPKRIRDALRVEIETALFNEYTEFPGYFFHLLLLFTNREKEHVIIDFLKGDVLTYSEFESLGFANGFTIDEDIAYKLIVSILKFSPFPFIISIDQIETIDKHLKREEIRNFFEKIVRLFSNSGNVLFLLSVQTQTFKKWEKFLPVNVAERLSERTTILPLTIKNAKEIIKKRNAFYFGKMRITPKDTFYPFREPDIEKLFFGGNKNPRKLIKAADHLLESGTFGIQKDTVKLSLPQYLKLANFEDFNYEIPDLIIKIFKKYKIIKRTPTYTIVKTENKAIVANNSTRSVYSSIKNLAKFIKSGSISDAILIRNKKINSTAKKTLELIKQWNIKVLYVSVPDTQTLIALSKMLRDAESQDIDLETETILKYAIDRLKNITPELFGKTSKAAA